MIPCPIEHPDFDLLDELENICIKILLLQVIQDIPIYAKTTKELCIKKSVRQTKITPIIHVDGTLFDLLLSKETPVKYEHPGNPIIIVHINGRSFLNALVDFGEAINIRTTTTCEIIGITTLEPTTTLLELTNYLVVRPEGTLSDVMVSIDTWEYPADFLIINLRNRLDGHPLILGRLWLATANAYISCWIGSMTITRGNDVNNLALYPPTQPSLTIVKTRRKPVTYLIENIRSPLTMVDSLEFKNQIEDDVINTFINHLATISSLKCHMIKAVLDNEIEEDSLRDINDQPIPKNTIYNIKLIEIEPGNILNTNSNLSDDKQQKLIQVLRKYKGSFAWDYPYMKGIDPQLLVPKKNGKWQICVDYIELNKATQKDHFPLPFIDQVLDTLAGKKFFSFLDGFSSYNQIQISPKDHDKTTFTSPWGTFAYRVLPFGLCNALATFQRAILSIFADLINEGLEVYMDDFKPYGDDFEQGLQTLEKVLERCIATRLCVSHEKCHMMMEGLILGHFISATGIQVDLAKV
eukprot:PITA_30756